MKGRLRVAVCWVLLLCSLVPAVGALGVYPSFKFKVYDHTGVRGAVVDGVGCEVTGHKMYAYISELYPGNLKVSVKWSSGSPGVASVSSKGVITGKKQGMARIYAKVTDRKTGQSRKSYFSVLILRNATVKTGMPAAIVQAAKDLKTITASLCEATIKSGNIYATMYVFNGGSTLMKKSAYFDIAFWPEFGDSIRMEDAYNVGIRKLSLQGNIPPNMLGKTKQFKIGKPFGFTASKDYLLDAFILSTGSNSKSAGRGDRAALLRALSGSIPATRGIQTPGARSIQPSSGPPIL